MSEHVQVGYGPNGRPVYAEVLSSEEIVEQLKASPEWQAFKDRFDMSAESNHTLLGWLYTEKLGDDPGLEDYQRLLKNIIRSGGIVTVRGTTYEFELRPAEPEPVVEESPVHRGQQLWSEYRQFSESHSIQECKQRAKADAGFASFMRKNYEREARETESTQFQLAGLSSADNKPKVTPELIAFAEEFRRTPTSEVRKRRNPVFNLSAAQYEQNFQSALAAGLV